MRKHIVIGLGFGDEGKGHMTSYLVSKSQNPLVIRFNGGHQAGHTVVFDNKKHVFSNFGSGSFLDAPTYWSEFCTIHPPAILKEFQSLVAIGVKPVMYIDPLCMITTPYDIFHNKMLDQANGHGSCGVGFGQTIKRNEDFYKLHAMDMLHPEILAEKLKNIAKYYNQPTPESVNNHFIYQCKQLLAIAEIKIGKPTFYLFDDLIFEGAQGVMLDMDFGFFPHVTRSNTTSKNVYTILEKNKLVDTGDDTDVYYISRLYQTRHGNGHMTNEGYNLNLKNTEGETNVESFQGKFRKGALDIDLLKYALSVDNMFSNSATKNILFTCADQFQSLKNIPCSHNNVIEDYTIAKILKTLQVRFNNTYVSYGPSLTDIKQDFFYY